MSQVLLDRVRVELTSDQIITALRQLSSRERDRVRRELDNELWRREFERLLARFQTRAQKNPLTDTEVVQEVKLVRAQRRARRLAQSGH